MPFEIEKLDIADVLYIKAKKFADDRGFFAELYKEDIFKQAGIPDIKQINFSKSVKGVLRGLHFQLPPFAQGKVVRAVKGEIFDVAVDLRNDSATFGRWVGKRLVEDEFNMLYIPEGFAHGFEVLSAEAEFEYFCTQSYAPQYERGILYNDPSINISWSTKNPIVSPKDAKNPPFSKTQKYF
ncbi:MAG: dTDP-4-dehydrorhamnose 3,5-epimerase [Elusimicrobiota bacterium]|jgi:dTDP-4-dehydrorhamnose 3,5-epimerase|nr:dTDP-4-dehydrorhamnose 3,5-epimerase [Elusimicrobiota bacterium]